MAAGFLSGCDRYLARLRSGVKHFFYLLAARSAMIVTTAKIARMAGMIKSTETIVIAMFMAASRFGV
jgi:hypothetical protein